MTNLVPTWALRPATTTDRTLAQHAYEQGGLKITWPESKALKAWMKKQGWPRSWLFYQDAFRKKMFASDEDFALALNESGIELSVPKEHYTLTTRKLAELDALYAEVDESGRPSGYGALVAGLREIRRAVEIGVRVKIEGTDTTLRSWSGWYNWAHGRYHNLEDGYDSWIGDDN